MNNKKITLDVREDIRKGREPFSKIMNAVTALQANEQLLLIAPFEPVPLFGVLEKRGFKHDARPIASGDWEVLFTRQPAWEALNANTISTNMNTTMQSENLVGPDKVMDVRPISCSVKHGLIIRAWLELPVGDHFILLNDHDPVPLYCQFSAQWPEAFTWEHLVKGPDEFRVKITKLNTTTRAAPGCCGGH